MTLEEHIKRYDDRAKSIRNAIVEKKESQEVVELLKELKAYREILTKLDVAIDCYENCESCQGFREYSTSQFIKDVIQINKEVNADESINSL